MTRILCFGLLICSLFACSKPPETFERRVLSFGTLIDVTLSGVSEQQADIALTQIESELNVMHDRWHAWRPSNLMQLNAQLQAGVPFTVDDDLLPLVEQSKRLSEASKGYFNPAIGKLVGLWGFHRDNPEQNTGIPDEDALQQLVISNPSMSDILIEGNQLTGKNKDIHLDFGGYAKGYGLEVLVELLRSQQIDNALINAGGDIKGIGSVGGRPWKIAIRHPIKSEPIAWLELQSGESIFTSGDYQRQFEYEGKRYHHIIDPSTGYPSTHARAVTVIHPDAATADAAATALMVAPKEDWLEVARSLKLHHFLIIDSSLNIYTDSALLKRLHPVDSTLSMVAIGTI